MTLSTEFTTRQRNIAATYYLASLIDHQSGMSWYANANAIAKGISHTYDISVEQAAGVIAALSPGCTWEKNIEYAERIISHYKAGTTLDACPNVGTYGLPNMRKCYLILDGNDVLETLGGDKLKDGKMVKAKSGFKVRAFYSLIVDQSLDIVCIDRHAVSIAEGQALGDEFSKYVSSQKKYDAVAEDYRVVAAHLGIAPHQLQAITWVTWRRIQNNVVDAFM